jgi:hypothetical protein
MNFSRQRISYHIALALMVALSSAVIGSGAEVWVRPLAGSDMKSAVVRVFNNPDTGYARSMACEEHGASVGSGFDTQITIYYVCRAAIDAKDLERLLSRVWRPITVEKVSKTTKVLCPYAGEFRASRVYITAKSLSTWDINDTAAYVNAANTEVLACKKVLVVQ